MPSMAVKATTAKKITKTPVTLGNVVMIYTKSSSHGLALVEPKIVSIEGIQFVEGKQVTGRTGHRMEGKRTLVPFEHIASLVEFGAEEELWSESQPKHLRIPVDEKPSAPLTSHEQPDPESRGGGSSRHRNDRRRGRGGPPSNKGPDARFQERYDARLDRNFNR